MTADERAALHERWFPHSPDRCPLEAAYSAHTDDRSLRLVIAIYVTMVMAVIVVSAAFPHSKLYNPWTQADDAFLLTLAFLIALTIGVSAGLAVPSLIRERSENHAIAASGPPCNPWVGLEHDRRSRRLAMFRATVSKVLLLTRLHRTAESKGST